MLRWLEILRKRLKIQSFNGAHPTTALCSLRCRFIAIQNARQHRPNTRRRGQSYTGAQADRKLNSISGASESGSLWRHDVITPSSFSSFPERRCVSRIQAAAAAVVTWILDWLVSQPLARCRSVAIKLHR